MKHSSIHSLFQEQHTLNYSILLYGSRLKEKETFTEWQVAEFVLYNDPYYRDLWQGSKARIADRIETIVKTVKRHIPSLLELRLIKQTGIQKQTKGTGLIPNYTLTPVGHLISRLVKSLEMQDGMAEKEILSVLEENIFKIHDDSHSFTIFNSKLIKKMYEKGLFVKYVSILREATKSKRIDDIKSFASLIQRTLSIEFHNPVLGRQFIDIWDETVDELEPDKKELFLYDQRLIIDVKMGTRAITNEYEKVRLQYRNETDKVILEGFCSSCKRRSVFPMKIIEYARRLALIFEFDLSKKCPKCETRQTTLQLPNLWD